MRLNVGQHRRLSAKRMDSAPGLARAPDKGASPESVYVAAPQRENRQSQ